jgi:anti-anti-sigma factor
MTEHLPGRLEIQTETLADDGAMVAVIRLEGEIDLANAEEFEAAVFSGAGRDAAAVVLNLAEVPFMDSSGLRVLLIAARDADRRVALVVPSDSPVMRLLEYAEMVDLMPVLPAEDEAIAAVREADPS